MIDEDSIHPMLRAIRPKIVTRPMERQAQSLATVLSFGRPSQRLRGDGRGGKTHSTYGLEYFKTWRPFNLGFLFTSAGEPERHTESYMFRDIVLGLGLRHCAIGTPHDSLFRIIRAVEEEAGRSDANTVILTIGEANRFTLVDYNHLVRLQNHFDRDLRLFFLLVWQNDAIPTSESSIESTVPPHVHGRFFVDVHDFTGLLWTIPDEDKKIQDVCDVALAFREYDQIMRWPMPGGPSYSEYFAPAAFNSGWRLEHQTDAIRAEIEFLCAAESLAVPSDWLMATFEPFVYFVLVHVAKKNLHFASLSKEDIRGGLKAAAFAEFERARQRMVK